MKLKRKTAWAALGLAMALALPFLSAVSPLPTQEVRAQEASTVVETAAVAKTAAATVSAKAVKPNPYGVSVNGVPMTTDPMLTVRNNVSYVSLRAMATALVEGAQVSWNGAAATVSKAGVLQLTAVPGQKYVIANGRYLPVENGVLTQNGAVLVPVDVIVKATDAKYTWNSDNTWSFTTGSGGILSGDAYYNSNDLYWLSRIIYAESGNQPLSGKIAVGNVVLNRVSSPRFPNSIYGVIFQRNQFSPAANGTIKRTPNAESVMAAKLCLDGAVELDNVLYFNRVGLKSWASRNRAFVATIAQHSFYA